ncbi:MAG: histidine phosphatase family protein, partial [Candidatus Limnocylindrales bacterium]
DQLDQLVGALRASSGNVLVAWEHKRIPLIANQLVGSSVGVPQVWPDDRFDLVWVFEPVLGRPTFSLRQVPQLLLAGDRAEPIA